MLNNNYSDRQEIKIMLSDYIYKTSTYIGSLWTTVIKRDGASKPNITPAYKNKFVITKKQESLDETVL